MAEELVFNDTREELVFDDIIQVMETDCQPGSVTLNGGSTIANDVPSGGSKDIPVHDSAGDDVGSTSGGVVTIGDAGVVLGSEGPLVLGDIIAEGTGVLSIEQASVDVTNDCTTDGAGKVIVPVSTPIVYARPQHCGQTVSYITGDAASQRANLFGIGNRIGRLQALDYGAANPLKTLVYDNIFGNKNRFTDDAGNDIYGNSFIDIRYDHLTGIIYDAGDFQSDLREVLSDYWARAQTKSETIDGQTYSNWYLAPWEYIVTLIETNVTANAEMRIGNTLGLGGICLSSSLTNNGTRCQYVSSSINTADQEDIGVTTGFSFIYMAFIEQGT